MTDITPADEHKYGADLDQRRYGTLDGDPCVWTPTNPQAWVLIGDAWKPLNSAEPFSNARVLTKSEFDKRFPNIPTPPQP